ncbi:MAG: T9SS type A sorting domain-containing protein [Bacteroidia bacterium]
MRQFRPSFFFLLLFLLSGHSISAASFYSKAAGGNWNLAATWVTACGGATAAGSVPGATDDVFICSGTVNFTATASCKSITVNNGGTLTFNTNTVTLNVSGNITVNSGGIVNYTVNGANLTVNLGGNLACTAPGSFSLVRNATKYGTLVFNGNSNAVVSGNGSISLCAMTLNTGAAATNVSVTATSFLFLTPYYFRLTRGTFKWNNMATLTDCYDNGSSSRLTVPYGVTLESDAGTMNLCQNGQTTISGQLLLNGGTVNTASSAGGSVDLAYLDNGGTPQLIINTGTLNVYGGINDNGNYSNYIDFEMTGGTINLGLGGGGPNYENLLLNNLANGKTIMTGGLITLQDAAVNNSSLDLDFGGSAIGAMGSATYNVSGGTIQFGTASSSAGGNYFWFQGYANTNYPNMFVNGISTSTALLQLNNTSNFIFKSLNIGNSFSTFEMRSASGGSSNQMTINGTNGTDAFMNSGTFTQRTSTVIFNGTMQQSIGPLAGNTTTFHNLTINNSSGTTSATGVIQKVATNLDGTGVMTFNNGSYALNGFTLTLQNGTTGAMTGASSSSYLISEDQSTGNMSSAVQWNIGNAASSSNFVFPFGYGGSYIPFTFGVSTASGNTGTTVTLATYESTNGTNLPYPSMTGQVVGSTTGALANAIGCHPNASNNSDLIVNRYWEITAGTQASLVASLTFSYLGSENHTIALCGGGPLGLLSPQRWDVTGGFWGAMIAGISTITAVYGLGTPGVTAGVGTVTAGGINTFSPWILVTTASPLPVELLDFTARETIQGSVDIVWKTASETNNAFFTVERSADGQHFESLEQTPGAGNSSSVNTYRTKDLKPLKGISYYRLRQTDFDGKSTLSNLAEVNLQHPSSFRIYPNPVNGHEHLTLVFSEDPGMETLVSIQDLSGSCVYSKTISAQKSEGNSVEMNFPDFLAKGMYFVIASNNHGMFKQKLIIQ